MHPHHYRFLVGTIIGLLIGGLIAGGLFWAYEYFWARFKPTLLTKDQTTIQELLNQGDWVSPGRKGAPVYLLTYRDCDACATYQRQEFPKLAAADVDTRVLVFVRPDASGQSLSTPVERSTVAELWINRDWNLYARWMNSPLDSWAPAGLRSADNDWARSAVVTATHAYVDKLKALLHENGLSGDDPILIWRDKKGRLKACACTDQLSYHFVRSDFGAPDKAPPAPPPPAAPVPTAPAGQAPGGQAPGQAPGQPPAGPAAPASGAPTATPSAAPGAGVAATPAPQSSVKSAVAVPAASPPAPAPASSTPPAGAPQTTKKTPAHAMAAPNSTFF